MKVAISRARFHKIAHIRTNSGFEAFSMTVGREYSNHDCAIRVVQMYLHGKYHCLIDPTVISQELKRAKGGYKNGVSIDSLITLAELVR